MKKVYLILAIVIILGMLIFFLNIKKENKRLENKNVDKKVSITNEDFLIYYPDLEKSIIKMYWKSDDGTPYKSMKEFISKLSDRKILFATNGEIYSKNYTPEGLYIENHKIISDLNLNNGEGNFYMRPNGVFYIENNKPMITDSNDFVYNKNISYAVQSGPLLIKNGEINKSFGENSNSLKVRSAVGIDKENKIFFYMSKKDISFYNFSKYALDELGCEQLLFLDGTISKMYFSGDRNISEQKYPFVTIISIEEKI